ncbi:response regulator [Cellulomonas hominis]
MAATVPAWRRESPVPTATRVALVEDDALLRTLLAETIDRHPRLVVVHSLEGVEQAKERLLPGTTDVVVVDIDLRDGNGVALSAALQREDPGLRVLLLSEHDVMDLAASIRGETLTPWSYLSKRSSMSSDVLLRAVEAVGNGGVVLDPALVRRLPRDGSPLASLTPAQLAVLRLVAEGLSNLRVAEALGVSPRSVESHLLNIYRALAVPAGDANPRVSAVLRFLRDSGRY